MITAQDEIKRIFANKEHPYIIGWGTSSITFYGKVTSIGESFITGVFLNIRTSEILKWESVSIEWVKGVFSYTEDINKYVHKYKKHMEAHGAAIRKVNEEFNKERASLNHEMAVACELEEDYDV